LVNYLKRQEAQAKIKPKVALQNGEAGKVSRIRESAFNGTAATVPVVGNGASARIVRAAARRRWERSCMPHLQQSFLNGIRACTQDILNICAYFSARFWKARFDLYFQ
jgi:hypothetical protein